MSLIEVMIALTILATVLISLGGLMYAVARHTLRSAAVGYATAAATSAATWAQGLPWDSIDGAGGCVSDTIDVFPYDRCASVNTINPQFKRVTVVISATGALTTLPESVVVDRHKLRPPSPFNAN